MYFIFRPVFTHLSNVSVCGRREGLDKEIARLTQKKSAGRKPGDPTPPESHRESRTRAKKDTFLSVERDGCCVNDTKRVKAMGATCLGLSAIPSLAHFHSKECLFLP